MMTREELTEFLESLGEQHVLSVYLSAESTAPSSRRSWLIRLKNETKDERDRLEREAPDQLRPFDLAFAHVENALEAFPGFLPEHGWVGFATPGGLLLAEALPAPSPELVAWEVGPRLAPYVRNLKLSRPVVVVLIDSRRARLLRSVHGEVEEIDTFSGRFDVHDGSDGVRKAASTTSGVRGETRADATARVVGAEIERMWKEVAHAVVELAGRDSHIVLGGPTGRMGAFRGALDDDVGARTLEIAGLHVGSSLAEVAEALHSAATDLTSKRQGAYLQDVIEDAAGGGHAALGLRAAVAQLERGAVGTLLLARDFLARESSEAETLMRLALHTGAVIEEVGGEPGARLDRKAGGVGVRLRFSVGQV